MKKIVIILSFLFSTFSFAQTETREIKEKQLIFKEESESHYIMIAFFTPDALVSEGYKDGYALFQMRDLINGKGEVFSRDLEYRDIGNNRIKLYKPHTDSLFFNVEFHYNKLFMYDKDYEFISKIPRKE